MRTRIDRAFEEEAGRHRADLLEEFVHLESLVLPDLRIAVYSLWQLIAELEGTDPKTQQVELTQKSKKYHEPFITKRDEWYRVLRRLQKLGRQLGMKPALHKFDIERGDTNDGKQDQRIDSDTRKRSANRRRRLSAKRRD